MNVNTRVAGITLVTAGAAALLAGCGPLSAPADPASGDTAPTVTRTVVDTPPETVGGPGPAQPPDDDLVPCTADVVEPELQAGDHSQPEVWNTTLVVTNVGTQDCRVEGVSDLAFVGQGGDTFNVGQSTIREGGPADDLVVLGPGGHAEMYISYDSAPDGDFPEDECSPPVSAVVTLPHDDQQLEVAAPGSLEAMPPLCHGPVQVTPWGPGDPA